MPGAACCAAAIAVHSRWWKLVCWRCQALSVSRRQNASWSALQLLLEKLSPKAFGNLFHRMRMRIFAAIRSTKLTFTNNIKYHSQASCKLAFHSGSKVYYPSSRASLDHLQLAHASSTTSSLSTTTSTMSTVLKVPKSNGLMGQAFKDWEDKVQAVNLPVRFMPILLDSSY